MAFFLSLLLVAYSKVTDLSDGKPELVDSDSLFGIDKTYRFHVGSVGTSDLTISLTTYSDYSDPDMFVSINQEPDLENFEYSSLVWGSGSIIIAPDDIEADSDYYVLVLCYTFCRYGLTVSFANEIQLPEGVPLSGSLTTGKQNIYDYVTSATPGTSLKIAVKDLTGKAEFYAITGDQEPTSDNSMDVDSTWDGGFEFNWQNPTKDTLVRVAVMAMENVTYTVLARNTNSQGAMIQASVPTTGEVSTGDFDYYYINVTSPDDVLYVSLTMFSGDGDIYVRAGEAPTLIKYNFSSVHMGNENLAITGQDRKFVGAPTGKYYIGIYGYVHAAYTLLVTTSNSSFVELNPGVPLSGSVNQSEIEHYFFEYPRNDTNVTVYLAVGSGNPDLYVKICSQNLSSCLFNASDIKKPPAGVFYSNHSTGGESIDIAHNQTFCPRKSTCFYVIGVVGVSSYSTYTLLATVNSTSEIVLRQGKAQSITMQDSSETYFKYTVINNTVIEVSFVLTPVYGDPDIYSAFEVPVDYTTYDKSSIHSGVEIDQVMYERGVDRESLMGTYHIMVHSIGASAFTIIAMETMPGRNSTIQLYPGHPQKDTIYNYTDQNYRIYYFPIHYTAENKQPIVISLTAITGKFNIYVANQLSNLNWTSEIFYYNWKNSTNTSDPNYVINIRTDDIWYKYDSTYLILVMGAEYLPDNSSTYVVSFTTGDGPISLSEDVPFTGVVLEGDYSYYTFPIHYSHEDVTISVTVMSGDPDLYISVSPSNPSPTNSQYDFKSTTFHNEAITLIWEQGLEEKCPDLPETYKFGDPVHCYLYIGVYGYHTSHYVIRVHPSKDLPQLLSAGQPLTGSLNATMYAFYYALVDTALEVHTILQQVSGDSDLFINIINPLTVGNNSAEWERPSRGTAQYWSQSTVLSEEIDLNSTQISAACPGTSCIVLAAVYCFSESCVYSISVRQNQLIQIMENQATYGSANNDYVYYSYYCDKDSTDFLVTVTTLNEGNPDLYISRGVEKRPTSEESTWGANWWGGDSIMIKHSDPFFEGGSMKGTYIIAVFGDYGPVSYALMVNNNPKPIVSLSSGVPQYGAVQENSTAYYSFDNFILQDIIITITPTSGSGRMYASAYYSWYGDVYANLPDSNYIWSSAMSADRFSLNISTTDPYFCTYCSILIAIKADNGTMNYSIVAKNDLDITVLQNGIPSRSQLPGAKWVLFSFEVLSKKDFDVSLTAYSGHPDLYITTNKTISWENFNWTAYYIEDTLNLQISKDDPYFKIGTYYIVVNGWQPSSFTIVAHTKDSAVTLVEGWPLSYNLLPSGFVNFRFAANTGKIVFCTMRSDDEFRPTVYTKFQRLGEVFSPATPASYEQEFSTPIMHSNYSTISMSLPHEETKGQLNIGVYSYSSGASGVSGTFELFCSGTSQTTMLRLGSMNIQMLDKDLRQMRYEMMTETKGTITAYVVPCIGDFRLEISSNWTIVFQETPDVVVNRMTDGIIEGAINNAIGRYYISVSTLMPLDYEFQIFELMTLFTKSGESPPKQISPGKDGILTWSSKDQDHIILSWEPVENEDRTPVENSGAEYKVFFSEEKYNNLVTSCEIHYFHSRNKIKFLGSTGDNMMELELPSDRGFINVVAVLPKNSNSPIKEIVYDPTEVLIGGPPQTGGLLLFWILATLLFLAVVASVYFYKKKKRAENILNYEMSDVRNVASVTSHLEKPGRADPYAPLSNIK